MADRKKRADDLGLQRLDVAAYLAQLREHGDAIPQAQVLRDKAGYSKLARKFDVARVELLEKLLEAGITVYTDESVEAYQKREREARYPHKEIARRKSVASSWRALTFVMWAVAIVVPIGVALALTNVWWWLLPLIPGVVLAGWIGEIAFEKVRSVDYVRVPNWVALELKYFSREVPRGIAAIATKALETIEDATLHVEELRESKDPFLVVERKGVKFYIGVWEEDGYEAEIIE